MTINPELLKWSLPLEKSNDLEGAFFELLSEIRTVSWSSIALFPTG